jgi:hypothetical protein
MRAVSLSNPIVQAKITKSFIPLKVAIDYGSQKFPLDWPAVKNWQNSYFWMGGPKTTGITACCVVSPDLRIQLATTGSAFVWEMFDAIAYDPKKFADMLDRSLERLQHEQAIEADDKLSKWEREKKLASYRAELKREIAAECRFHLPPRGFTGRDAKELFRLSGDLTN